MKIDADEMAELEKYAGALEMENIIVRYAENSDYEMVEVLMKQVQQLHVEWRPDIYKMADVILPKDVFQTAVQEKNFLVAESDGIIMAEK